MKIPEKAIRAPRKLLYLSEKLYFQKIGTPLNRLYVQEQFWKFLAKTNKVALSYYCPKFVFCPKTRTEILAKTSKYSEIQGISHSKGHIQEPIIT